MTPPRPKQTIAQYLRDDLLRLLWQKFYQADPAGNAVASKCFAQDRARLLGWVILWPARFISDKGFTLTGERYKKIISEIILEALRHGNTTRLSYRPAWLRMVVQSHFKNHWEEYYAEAKAVGIQAEHTLLMLGKLPVASQTGNPMQEMAAAATLLARSKPQKKPVQKPSSNLEFNL